MPSGRRFLIIKTNVSSSPGVPREVIGEIVDFVKDQPEFDEVTKYVSAKIKKGLAGRLGMKLTLKIPITYTFLYKEYEIQAQTSDGKLDIQIKRAAA